MVEGLQHFCGKEDAMVWVIPKPARMPLL